MDDQPSPIMAGRFPEDIEPELPGLSPYLRNGGYDLILEDYPGGRKEFDRYFEAYRYSTHEWQVKRKRRTQIISIVYGDKIITDVKILERFYDALKRYQPIAINNDTLGCDPQPGTRKVFVMEYRNVNNKDERYLKRRKMLENETLDFGWDIVGLTWGLNTLTWSLDRFPKAFENLFWVLDHKGDMLVSCENLDCDPAPGQKKACRVDYLHPQYGKRRIDVAEGSRLSFSGRWTEPNKRKREPECRIM